MTRWLRASWPLAAILVVALGLRLAAGAWWQSRLPAGDRFGFGDSDSYWALGRAIAERRPYQYGEARVFRTPGYPLVLSPLFWIGGDEPPAAWGFAESAVLGTVAVGGVFWLARMLFDRRAGLIAAGIAAVYPGAISQGALVLSEAPFVPLMIVQLALWGLAWRSDSKQRSVYLSIATGIVAGLAILTRPSWLFFSPIAALVALASASVGASSRSRGLKPTLRWRQIVVLTALVLTISPWWIRNYVVTGHFVPTTLQVGASLYDGLNPMADGGSNMRFGDDYVVGHEKSWGPIRRVSPPKEPAEYRRDQHLAAAAIDFARSNPLRAMELAGIKFLRTWNIWANESGLRSWQLRLAVATTYLPLLTFGLWGAMRFSKRGWPYVLCWLPAPYFALLHIVFVGSIRYREPAMIAMIPLAAGVVSEWLARRRGAGAPTTA
jgi:4-amino-4-deoxy-L-arabinose transferase-like glycosyltransferase